MKLADYTRPELVFLQLPGRDGAAVLGQLSEALAAAGAVEDADGVLQRLLEREALCSTGIGSGIAIPHCKLRRLKQPVLALATTETPIDFKALDGGPVQLFFLLISPEDSPAEHLQILAGISKWIKTDPEVVGRMCRATTAGQIFALLTGGEETGSHE
jgi:PTS system nitrogen regulatory IIA component